MIPQLIFEPIAIATHATAPLPGAVATYHYICGTDARDDGYTREPVEDAPEFAGRLCYDSFGNPRPGGPASYFGNILGEGHGSVLEHASITVALAGIDRDTTHQLIRHRAGMAYSQRSQRYCDESTARFVVPEAMQWPVRDALIILDDRGFDSAAEACACHDFMEGCQAIARAGVLWLAGREYDLAEYAEVVAALDAALFRDTLTAREHRKQVRQAARRSLPGCVETRIAATGNLRAWRNVIEQRTDPGADAEIRRAALAILAAVRPLAPNIFADFDDDGTPGYSKV